MGLGYAQNLNPNPMGGPERPKYLKLALQMVRMWISFVNYGDPNKNLGGKPIPFKVPTWHMYARLFASFNRESVFDDPC